MNAAASAAFEAVQAAPTATPLVTVTELSVSAAAFAAS
jgi:hypothetical protein